MQAISDRHYEMMHPSRPPPPQDVLGMGMPGMPDMLFSSADMLLPPMTHVYINAPATASPPAFEQGSSRQTSVNVLSADQYQWVEPRPLRRIDPTVSFKSAAAAPLWSTCRVYCESTFLHESAAQAMEVRDDAVEGAYLYFATLAPGYWHTLCAIPGESAWRAGPTGERLTRPPLQTSRRTRSSRTSRGRARTRARAARRRRR